MVWPERQFLNWDRGSGAPRNWFRRFGSPEDLPCRIVFLVV